MPILENVADGLARIDAERFGALGCHLRADHEIEQAAQQRNEDIAGPQPSSWGHRGAGSNVTLMLPVVGG